MKIAIIYNKKHIDLEGIRLKNSPTDYTYGAIDLEKMGHRVDFVNTELGSFYHNNNKARMMFFRVIAPFLLNRKLPDQYLIEALRFCDLLNTKNYDVVITIPQKMTLGLACCKKWGGLHPEVIGIQTGVINQQDNYLQKYVLRNAYNSIHSIVLGEGELVEMRNRYGIRNDLIDFLPFGVDTDFWTPAAENSLEEPLVLSVGNDYFRDFELLIKVAKLIAVKFIIVSRLNISGSLPPNVQIIQGSAGNPALTFQELRNLYRSATCVVTPVKETNQPSGQSSTLQAMACGIPTVISAFKGLWSHEQIQDGRTALLYETGDVKGCCNAIQLLLSDINLREKIANNARKMVEAIASSKQFSLNLNELCEYVTNKKKAAAIT